MAEFAVRQKQFLESNHWIETSASDLESNATSDPSMEVEDNDIERHKEYDCVICNQSIPSTPERPVGLCVLLQVSFLL